MTVNVRSIRYPGEYPSIYALWERAGSGVHLGLTDQPAEMDKKITRDPDLFLVAEKEGRLVGAVLGGFDGRRGLVYHLAVDEGERRQGIGEALMKELEERFRQKGCRRYYLLVTWDNPEALHFYEQRGARRMDLAVLGKDLD
jgi:ribosomal protein S18 acetylase RimI-like enzyme